MRKDTRHFISIELKFTSKNAESFQHKTRKTPQKAFWTVLLATLQVLFMKETVPLTFRRTNKGGVFENILLLYG